MHQTALGAFRSAAGDALSLDLGNSVGLDSKNVECQSPLMTQGAKKLLEAFDALPAQDRAEILNELLRRIALGPHDLPQDEDLVAAADRLFADLDRREQPE